MVSKKTHTLEGVKGGRVYQRFLFKILKDFEKLPTLRHKVNNNLFGAVAPTLHWHGFKMSNGYYWYVMPRAKMNGHAPKLTLARV